MVCAHARHTFSILNFDLGHCSFSSCLQSSAGGGVGGAGGVGGVGGAGGVGGVGPLEAPRSLNWRRSDCSDPTA